MPGNDKSNAALNKLFRLDFYKRQRHWRLASGNPEVGVKSKINSSTLLNKTIRDIGGDGSLENIVEEPTNTGIAMTLPLHTPVELENYSPQEDVILSGNVSERIKQLVLIHQAEIEVNFNNEIISDTVILDSPAHDSSERDSYVEGEESPVTNYIRDLLGLDRSESGLDASGRENSQADQEIQPVNWEAGLLPPYSVFNFSIESFMRGMHNRPHSSEEDLFLDYDEDADELSSRRLAELSPRQLCLELSRHSEALRRLVEEASLRNMSQPFHAPFSSSAWENEIFLAGSIYPETGRGRGRQPRFSSPL